MTSLELCRRQLVAANRILSREDVVDAFGHVSVRHPEIPGRYIMACSRSPGLVTDSDLLQFSLDGTLLDADTRGLYSERMIHGAAYEGRPEVGAVVHNHSLAVLPFGLTGKPLRPVMHVAGLIGEEIPRWEVRDEYGDDTDLLVRTMDQGRSLMRKAGKHNCVLMCGHGAAVFGHTLKHAVIRAIYLQINASVQTQAMAFGEFRALSPGEVQRTTEVQSSQMAIDRAWEYFCQRAGVDPV